MQSWVIRFSFIVRFTSSSIPVSEVFPLFTDSGHGDWVPDQNGDEVDGKDEGLAFESLPINQPVDVLHFQTSFAMIRVRLLTT